jgi:hypothetical protein
MNFDIPVLKDGIKRLDNQFQETSASPFMAAPSQEQATSRRWIIDVKGLNNPIDFIVIPVHTNESAAKKLRFSCPS